MAVIDRAYLRLSNKSNTTEVDRDGDSVGVSAQFRSRTGLASRFPAIPEVIIRVKEPTIEPMAFAENLLDLLARSIKGMPAGDDGFVNTHVENILVHTPFVPKQHRLSRLHNRDYNFNLIISRISQCTRFTPDWVKSLCLGAWSNLWTQAMTATLSPRVSCASGLTIFLWLVYVKRPMKSRPMTPSGHGTSSAMRPWLAWPRILRHLT